MTPHEKQLITELFTRLAKAERLPLPRDGETVRLIRELVAGQPYASYLMVQTIIGQAQALRTAQEGLDALAGRRAADARAQDKPPGGVVVPATGRPQGSPAVSDDFLVAAASVAMVVGGGIAVETPAS